MTESIVILLALIAGILVSRFAYPPLLGYLIAGFLAGGLGIGDKATLEAISGVGITLLLFTIGLKLNLKQLAKPQVWGVGISQILIAIPLFVFIIWGYMYIAPGFEKLNWSMLCTISFALTFSSTVFAVKTFDERGESGSFHAQVTIGILVLQDLFAVLFLAYKTEMIPHWWGLGLLLLPFLRPLFLKVIDMCGHSELLSLCGIALAFGASELFYLCNIKGDLGALAIGAIIGNSSKGNELYKNLIGFKDLFLIAFFVSVGYAGLPSLQMAGLAVVLVLLVPLRTALYFLLFTRFNMRARTSTLASFGLSNYSEFGLIVTHLAVTSGLLGSEWLTTIAMALTLSFFLATPFNTNIHDLYAYCWRFLMKFQKQTERPKIDLKGADILILGMGRLGVGAYDYFDNHCGNTVLGVEALGAKAKKLKEENLNIISGDVCDYEFWEQINQDELNLIMVCLSNHKENMDVINMMIRHGYKGKIAAVAKFADEQKELQELGCVSFDFYAEAGYGFGEHVIEKIPELMSKES